MFVLNILFFVFFREVFEIVAVPERAEQTLRPSAEDSLDELKRKENKTADELGVTEDKKGRGRGE